MATCNDIIRRALQMTSIVALGEVPTADEAEFGMEALQSMYDAWVEGGMFGRLKDVYKTEDYEAQEQERVIAPSGVTVTLPVTVESVEGDRAPREMSCIVTIINGVQVSRIYHKGAWLTLNSLDVSDEAPLSDRGAFGLAASLALMIAETFQRGAVSASVASMARQFIGGVSLKLGATARPSETVYY
jgi:hypothetical protein